MPISSANKKAFSVDEELRKCPTAYLVADAHVISLLLELWRLNHITSLLNTLHSTNILCLQLTDGEGNPEKERIVAALFFASPSPFSASVVSWPDFRQATQTSKKGH
jgi:hypothetical protein